MPNPGAVAANLPFAMTPYMSPFVANNVKTRSASTDAIKASIMVLPAKDALMLITREDARVKEWNDPRIDVYRTNIRERYAVGVKHKGRSISVAKGVSTQANYGPIWLRKTIAVT